jgi:hypothetical protein
VCFFKSKVAYRYSSITLKFRLTRFVLKKKGDCYHGPALFFSKRSDWSIRAGSLGPSFCIVIRRKCPAISIIEAYAKYGNYYFLSRFMRASPLNGVFSMASGADCELHGRRPSSIVLRQTYQGWVTVNVVFCAANCFPVVRFQ